MWSVVSWVPRSIVALKFPTVVVALYRMCCDDQVSEWLWDLGCRSSYKRYSSGV